MRAAAKRRSLRRHVAAAGAVGCAVCALLAQSAELLESLYAQRISPTLSGALAGISDRVAISLAEVVLAAGALFVAVAICAVVRLALGGAARRWDLPAVARRCGATTVAAASLLAASFLTLWGLNYQRAGLGERLGWPPLTGTGEAALAATAETLVAATNEAYEDFSGSLDLGAPTASPYPLTALDGAIGRGLLKVAPLFGLPRAHGAAVHRAKLLGASELLSYLGLGGFFFPWTAEANVNFRLPAVSLPPTIGHEKAHQLGFAREDEASMVGHVACLASGNRYARYAAFLAMQRSVLAALPARDSDLVRRLVAGRLPGVQRDVDATIAHWRRYAGAAQTAARAVNDGYLKMNRDSAGVASYGRVADLIARFAVRYGGAVEVPREHRGAVSRP